MEQAIQYPTYYRTYLSALEQHVPIRTDHANDALGISYSLTIDFMASIYPTQLSYSYAENKWTIAEVMGHLIDTDRVFSYRALQIARGFEGELSSFDENQFVENSNYHEREYQSLKDELFAVFEATGYLFEGFTKEMLDTQGFVAGKAITPLMIGHVVAAHRVHHLQVLNNRYLENN